MDPIMYKIDMNKMSNEHNSSTEYLMACEIEKESYDERIQVGDHILLEEQGKYIEKGIFLGHLKKKERILVLQQEDETILLIDIFNITVLKVLERREYE